jgi:hypothetical protein
VHGMEGTITTRSISLSACFVLSPRHVLECYKLDHHEEEEVKKVRECMEWKAPSLHVRSVSVSVSVHALSFQTSETQIAKWCNNPRSHKSCGMWLYVLVISLTSSMLQLVNHPLSFFASPIRVCLLYHKMEKKHFNYMHCWSKLNGQSK